MQVAEIETAKSILKNINWNFYEKNVIASREIHPFDCRKHHWFPATFIPEIPFTLIEILTLPNAKVWDPFSGIGTSFFQAISLNRKALATEICIVAVEFMRSLFVLFNPEIKLEKLELQMKRIIGDFNPAKDYTSRIPKRILIDKLRPWFSKNTLNQLSFLFSKEEEYSDYKEVEAISRICISSLLRTASSQDRGWGCIADNVLPKEEQIKDKDAIKLFNRNTKTLIRAINEHLKNMSPNYDELYEEVAEKPTIYHEDARKSSNIIDDSVDFVVTSPPYPNMTDYVTAQRLSYYYLGYDLTEKRDREDLSQEIGARHRRSRRNALELYLRDMMKINYVISKKLKKGGYACYVMPEFNLDNQNNRNRKIVVQQVIANMAEQNLMKEDEYERILPTKRRAHNVKWATLEREKIYLFRKL